MFPCRNWCQMPYIRSVTALRGCWMIFCYQGSLFLCILFSLDYPLDSRKFQRLAGSPLDLPAVWSLVLTPVCSKGLCFSSPTVYDSASLTIFLPTLLDSCVWPRSIPYHTSACSLSYLPMYDLSYYPDYASSVRSWRPDCALSSNVNSLVVPWCLGSATLPETRDFLSSVLTVLLQATSSTSTKTTPVLLWALHSLFSPPGALGAQLQGKPSSQIDLWPGMWHR